MKLPEYKTFKEKDRFYQSTRITNATQFDREYDFLKQESKYLIFRGLRESRFKNYTSGQRAWITNRLSRQISYFGFIQRVLDNIKKNQVLREYYLALKVIPNDLLYLSFLQHYGAPTPMLDFTHDLDTALFFAFDGVTPNQTGYTIGDYVSVYYLDRRECGEELVDMIGMYNSYPGRIHQEVLDFQNNNQGINVDESIIKEVSQYVQWGTQGGFSNVTFGLYDGIFTNTVVTLPLSGQTLVWANLNLIAQKGCFVNYNHDKVPLEVFLAKYSYLPKMHCIDIPKSFEKYVAAKIQKKREDIYPQEEDIAKQSFENYMRFF